MIVEGDDRSHVVFKCLQGDFEWEIGKLRQQRELSFSGKDGGRLVVRSIDMLGDQTIRLDCYVRFVKTAYRRVRRGQESGADCHAGQFAGPRLAGLVRRLLIDLLSPLP